MVNRRMRTVTVEGVEMTQEVSARKGSGAPLMSHTERQALIRRPFKFEIIQPRTWGGVLIADERRGPGPGYGEDESYLRYGRSDDPGQGD